MSLSGRAHSAALTVQPLWRGSKSLKFWASSVSRLTPIPPASPHAPASLLDKGQEVPRIDPAASRLLSLHMLLLPLKCPSVSASVGHHRESSAVPSLLSHRPCVSASCSIHHGRPAIQEPGIPTRRSLLNFVCYYYLGPRSPHRAWHRAGVRA